MLLNRILSKLALASVMAGIFAVANAQSWTPIKNPPQFRAYNPTLLLDGTVMMQDGDNDHWYKLTPDNKGSYVNGTWSELARSPGYGPLYYASAVLTDGRVFTMGGEYNMGSGTIWQNTGYIYDPQTDTWKFIAAPSGWDNIGDMGSVVFPNGKLMIADPLSTQSALFDPATNILQAPYSTNKADGNDEEGLTLLPNGNVLTVDATISNGSEILNTQTGVWSSGGSTPASLVGGGEEIGAQVLRPDGTVICFGGGGHNCIYNTKTQTWSLAPDFPTVAAGQLDCADAPACLLPNGHVLVQTSPGLFLSGSVFFEWDGAKMTQVPATQEAFFDPSFVGNFLMLPTGQVLYCNQGDDMEFYTSSGTYDPSWRPTITDFPSTIKAGLSYKISGTQFNGLSQCSAYGDDEQNATNYALVRITNTTTGDVQYCRVFSPSTMAVATGSQIVSTNFAVPSDIEVGPGTLEVVTNGIPSMPVAVDVEPAVQASSVSVFQGKNGQGSVSDVWHIDGNFYSVHSLTGAVGQYASVEADFNLGSSSLSGLKVFGAAQGPKTATEQIYVYDWTTSTFVFLKSVAFKGGTVSVGGTATAPFNRYVGPNGKVRVVVRAVVPPRLATGNPFVLKVDAIQLASS